MMSLRLNSNQNLSQRPYFVENIFVPSKNEKNKNKTSKPQWLFFFLHFYLLTEKWLCTFEFWPERNFLADYTYFFCHKSKQLLGLSPPPNDLSSPQLEKFGDFFLGVGRRKSKKVTSCYSKNFRCFLLPVTLLPPPPKNHAKRHLIIYPPQGPFFGRVTFSNNSMNFWFWSDKKFLVRLSSKLELLMCLSADSC